MAKPKARSTKRHKAAATMDIIGRPPRPPRVPTKWKVYYDRLVRLRGYLLARQGHLVRDANEEQSAYSLHMADAATDSFDRDLALSRASSEQDVLLEIDEALERIRARSYGNCEITGRPIEAARLEAVPWTRFSLEAEQLLEKEGAIQRARLGSREPVPRGGTEKEDADLSQG
jgi:DnaK suppressor protein